MKKRLSVLIRIAVSFGLLAGLFWIMRKDAKNILEILFSCNTKYLAAALAIFICNSAALAYRMKIVFHGENLSITFWESLQLTCIGFFFNNFLPTAVGGDVIKAHYAATHNNSRMRSYASVMMDRVIGLYSFLIVAAVALIVDRGNFQVASIRPIVFSFLILGITIFVTVTSKRVAVIMERFFMRIKLGKLGSHLDSLYKIVHDYKNRLDVVGKSLLVSIFSQCVYFITIYMFFLSLGSQVHLGNVFLVMPVVTFISMMPSVGGLGVRESAIVAFFSPLTGKDTAFAASLLLLFGLFAVSFIGGIFYLHWSMLKKQRKGDTYG